MICDCFFVFWESLSEMCSFLSLNQEFEREISFSGFNSLFDRFDSAVSIVFFSWTCVYLLPSCDCPFLCMMFLSVCIDAYKYIFTKRLTDNNRAGASLRMWIFESSSVKCCTNLFFYVFRCAELLETHISNNWNQIRKKPLSSDEGGTSLLRLERAGFVTLILV